MKDAEVRLPASMSLPLPLSAEAVELAVEGAAKGSFPNEGLRFETRSLTTGDGSIGPLGSATRMIWTSAFRRETWKQADARFSPAVESLACFGCCRTWRSYRLIEHQ